VTTPDLLASDRLFTVFWRSCYWCPCALGRVVDGCCRVVRRIG